MTIKLQPTLKSELLELRPLGDGDFDALFAIASDPLIWEQHPSSDRYKPEVFREFFQGALDSRGALVAIDQTDGKIIGSSRFAGHDEVHREIEIGWTFLARSHWGGRWNREMKALMLSHILRFVDTVYFVVGPRNFRSRHALEKIGAIHVPSRPDPLGRGHVYYEITAADYFKK